jgi:hypothetical protein
MYEETASADNNPEYITIQVGSVATTFLINPAHDMGEGEYGRKSFPYLRPLGRSDPL